MATWFPLSKWVWFGKQDPHLCPGLFGRYQPRRGSVSATSSLEALSDVSPKAPLLCFPSRLLQILLQFSACLAGILANVIFVVVPQTGVYWLINLEVRARAWDVFHQAPCSSRLQTLSPSLLGLPGLAA